MQFGTFETPDAGKHFRADGASETQGAFTRGRYRTVNLTSLTALHAWLEQAPATVHMTGGVAAVPEAEALSTTAATALLNSGAETGPIVTRTLADITWPRGPALMTIDTDGRGDLDDIWAALCTAAPGLALYAALQTSSTSSRVSGPDGAVWRGDEGCHTYLHAADGEDVPRALAVLHKRLILAGHAMHKLSKAGGFLNRSPVDVALKRSNQPIYTRAHLPQGATQDKVFVMRAGLDVVDTRAAIPNLTDDEILRYEHAVARVKLDMLPEGERVRMQYRAAMVQAGRSEADVDASLGGDLGPEHVICLAGGETATVGQILADPVTYHGKACCDPVESDYGGAGVAKIYATQNQPCIHSFAHGSSQYRLRRDLSDVTGQTPAMWAASERQQAQAACDASLALQWLSRPVSLGGDDVLDWLSGERPERGTVLPGIGLVFEGKRTKIEVERLLHWLLGNVAHMLTWARVVVIYGGIGRADIDTTADVVRRELKHVDKRAAVKALTAALDAWESELPQLIPVGEPSDMVPTEGDVAAARRSAELLGQCRHIAANPLGELDKRLTRQGVMGERAVANTVLLSLATGGTEKPVNCIVKGQSSAGKSHTTNSVTALWPDDYVFRSTSMSEKALIYIPPGSIKGKHILLEEGDSLARQKSGELNPFAQMMRVIISLGYLEHFVTQRDPETGAHTAVPVFQEGPTGLITTTTIATLDDELETRMLSVWCDETEEQTSAVMGSVAATAAGLQDGDEDVSDWHAFAHWLRSGPQKAVVPFAGKIADLMPKRAVRARRDIRSLLDLIKASAILHRLNREIDDKGRIIATLDDYDAAVAAVGEALSEGHDEVASDNALNLLRKMKEALDAAIASAGGWTADGRLSRLGGLPKWTEAITYEDTYRVCVKGSYRDLSHVLDLSKTSISRHISHCVAEGFLERYPFKDSKTYIVTTAGANALNTGKRTVFPPREDVDGTWDT